MNINFKERAIRLAKELYPKAQVDELLISASKLEDYLSSMDCKDSFPTFARKCTVQHPMKGYMAFEPYSYQKELIDFLPHSKRIIINTARQMGTTFLLSCYALWEAIHTPYQTIVVASNNFANSSHVHNNILVSYDQHCGYKPGLTSRTKNRIEFSNGSKVIFTAFTENALRGMTINTLIVDNAAYVSHSAFANCMPVLASTNAKVILASTPHTAEGPFYDLWTEVNDWFKVALPWTVHPDRDQAWAQHMRGIMPPEQFAKEFECKFSTPVKP